MLHLSITHIYRNKLFKVLTTLTDTVALPFAAVLTYVRGELCNWEVSFDIHLELLAPTGSHLWPVWTCSSPRCRQGAGPHRGSHWGNASRNTTLKCIVCTLRRLPDHCNHCCCQNLPWMNLFPCMCPSTMAQLWTPVLEKTNSSEVTFIYAEWSEDSEKEAKTTLLISQVMTMAIMI